PEANRRVNPEDLRRDEWGLADLAGELGMPAITLQHWCYRGWVRARKSSEVRGTWIFWGPRPVAARPALGACRESTPGVGRMGRAGRAAAARQCRTEGRSARTRPRLRRTPGHCRHPAHLSELPARG